MNEPVFASEQTKTAIEDSISWLMSEKMDGDTSSIVTQKYMTSNNLLVYLTQCSLPGQNTPRFKVQVLQRVAGGVHETGYHLFGDHRFEKYENDMLFGGKTPEGADGSKSAPVIEEEAQQLLGLIGSLQHARQTP